MTPQKLHARPLPFDKGQKKHISRCLHTLAAQISAPLVMLADITGQLIVYRGRMPLRQSIGLAALAAGSFSASVELGRFLGLRNDARFQTQLNEGSRANLYTVSVGSELLLIVAFTKKTTLPHVLDLAKEVQKELLEIAEIARQAREQQVEKVERLEPDFLSALSDELDDFFQDDDLHL